MSVQPLLSPVPRGVPAELVALNDKLNDRAVELDRLDRYYSGLQPLRFVAPEIAAQLGSRLTTVVVNWPRVATDSITRRSTVEGFRVGEGGQTDDELWRMWQANDMDEWLPLALTDSLLHGSAYLSVWEDEEDSETPRITVESAHQVAVSFTPGTRRVGAALKRYTDGPLVRAIFMLGDRVVKYVGEAGSGPESWQVEDAFPNPLGVPPIVPLPNRARVLNLDGESELTDLLPIADAINKLATDMMVTSEYYASPRRYVTGIEIPRGENRERLQAEIQTHWDQATRSKTWLGGKGIDFGQFPEASLDGFVSGINLLTASLAAIAGLPPDDLGLNTTNPASAEARRAAETTLVLRTKEKHRSWGGGCERATRMALALRDGVRLSELRQEFRRMETVWADPGSPAVAQTFDAAVKGVESGILDQEQAREFVGLTPVQRDAIRSRAEAAVTQPVRAQVELARELQRTEGLSQNASLAAVGLLQAAGMNRAETPGG